MVWNRKDGRRNKDFKKGGKLGQGVGALKRGMESPIAQHGFYQVVWKAGCQNFSDFFV